MTKEERKRLLRWVCGTCVLVAAAAGAAAVFHRTGGLVPCLFRTVTGFSCPGCGNTRAAVALLHLRFAESLSYNYAYPAEFLYLLLVYVRAAKHYVKEGRVSVNPKYSAAEYVFLGLLLVWWVVRNILGV